MSCTFKPSLKQNYTSHDQPDLRCCRPCLDGHLRTAPLLNFSFLSLHIPRSDAYSFYEWTSHSRFQESQDVNQRAFSSCCSQGTTHCLGKASLGWRRNSSHYVLLRTSFSQKNFLLGSEKGLSLSHCWTFEPSCMSSRGAFALIVTLQCFRGQSSISYCVIAHRLIPSRTTSLLVTRTERFEFAAVSEFTILLYDN